MADYAMKVEKGITVTMRDGVRLSLCVYRPDTAGQFPALFAASPYQYEMDDVPAYPLFLWRETGPVEWYVSQGYAYVHADVRGAGQSEGEFEFMGLNEQQDYLELIAWIVKQPWCSGQSRRHRPVLLRHGAMADGDLQPARPRLHRALRRSRRPISRLELSWRHLLLVSLGLVHVAARRQPAPARRQARPAADEIRSGRRDHQSSARRRLLAPTLALLAARQDQVPGAVSRALGQDGPASARQHPRLRGGQGAEEARRHRRAQYFRGAPHVRPGRIPRKGIAAVLRSSSQGRQQRLHGRRAGKAVRTRRQCVAQQRGMAAAAHDAARLTICARGRLAASVRSTMVRCRPNRLLPAMRRQVTLIPTGNGSMASPLSVPDGRVDPPRRVLDIHQRSARRRSRRRRADRAQAVRVIDRDRYPVHRQADRPASASSGRARPKASSPASRRYRRDGSRPRTAKRIRCARSRSGRSIPTPTRSR